MSRYSAETAVADWCLYGAGEWSGTRCRGSSELNWYTNIGAVRHCAWKQLRRLKRGQENTCFLAVGSQSPLSYRFTPPAQIRNTDVCTVQAFDSCTRRPDVWQCRVVQISTGCMSKISEVVHASISSKPGMRPYIIPSLPTHLVQELNDGMRTPLYIYVGRSSPLNYLCVTRLGFLVINVVVLDFVGLWSYL